MIKPVLVYYEQYFIYIWQFFNVSCVPKIDGHEDIYFSNHETNIGLGERWGRMESLICKLNIAKTHLDKGGPQWKG